MGTVPGIVSSSSRTEPSTGIDPISPCVYGCLGLLNRVTASASSTIWPAYMTATRSAISATIPGRG
jgi:hypothetical protein